MISKKHIARFMAIILFILGFAINISVFASGEKTFLIVDGAYVEAGLKAGQTSHIKVPVRAVGSTIWNIVKVELLSQSDDLSFTNIRLISPSGYEEDFISFNKNEKYIDFYVSVKETAKIQRSKVKVIITYLSSLFEEEKELIDKEAEFYMQITQEKEAARLTINPINNIITSAGLEKSYEVIIKNEGEITAKNIYLNFDYDDDDVKTNIKKNAKKIKVGDILPNQEIAIKLLIPILSKAEPGSKILGVDFTYKDINGGSFSEKANLYIDIEGDTKINKAEITSITYNQKLNPGDEFILLATISNLGSEDLYNIDLSIDESSIGVSGFIKNYFSETIQIKKLDANSKTDVKIPLIVSKEATRGLKPLKLNLTYKDNNKDKAISSTVYPEIIGKNVDDNENDKEGVLLIKDVKQNPQSPVADGNVYVTFKLENKGKINFKDIKITPSYLEDSFYPVNSNPYILVDKLDAGKSKVITIPLKVSKNIKEGYNQINIKTEYSDEKGKSYVIESTSMPILNVENPKQEDVEGFLLISNVKQSPSKPNAGGQVNISFSIENKSKGDFKDIKLIQSYMEESFSPIDSEPYIFIDELKAGKKKTITIQLMVSKNIKEGLNNISIKAEYTDKSGKVQSGEPISIPILDVINESTISKPKIIVSKFSSDIDELKAGANVKFNFQFKNTNAKIAAKNITITLSQKDSIFSIAQGSNSFFVDKINPEETIDYEVEMKIKSDASTNTYPLTVKLEYEYEGAPINPVTGELGETKEEELNLLVIENSRPVVDYINVYSMMGMPTVNENATLTFEFYNMGKSTLNNVVASIEGDFIKADGNMTFIGNVAAGSSEFVEFEVIPTIDGLAQGILTITFEDSNGDEVVMTKEFESQIEGQVEWNPGDDEFPDDFEVPEEKKPIIKLWQFALILLATIIIVPLITKAIILSIYKKKLRKKDDEY